MVIYELQVRTIFEEGWSEIDHRIRYPDFTDDVLIQDFLHIFNRISGSADEMGTFVNKLAADLKTSTAARLEAQSRAESFSVQLDEKIEKLNNISSKNTEMQNQLRELKSLISDRETQSAHDLTWSRVLDRSYANIKTINDLNEYIDKLGISKKSYEDALSSGKKIKDILGKNAARERNSGSDDPDAK